MELQRNSHHEFRLMYHFVWVTKYRHKVFMEPYRRELKGIIGKIGYVMQVMRSISAREFFRIRPEIKRKYFWGGKLWTQSYFVETISNANEEIIRQYVQNQLTVMDEMEERFGQLPLF